MTTGEVGSSHTSPVFITCLTSTDVFIEQQTVYPNLIIVTGIVLVF